MGKFGSILSEHAMSMDRKKLNSMSYDDRKEAVFGGLADKMMAQRKARSVTMANPETKQNVDNQAEMGSALRNTLFRR